MPTDPFDGLPVVVIVFFVVVAGLIVAGIVRAATGLGRGTPSGGPPGREDSWSPEHQRTVDQQLAQQSTPMPPDPGMHGGGHQHADHTPPQTPPSP